VGTVACSQRYLDAVILKALVIEHVASPKTITLDRRSVSLISISIAVQDATTRFRSALRALSLISLQGQRVLNKINSRRQ